MARKASRILQMMALMKLLLKPSLIEEVDPLQFADEDIQIAIDELKKGERSHLIRILRKEGLVFDGDGSIAKAIITNSVAQSKAEQIDKLKGYSRFVTHRDPARSLRKIATNIDDITNQKDGF